MTVESLDRDRTWIPVRPAGDLGVVEAGRIVADTIITARRQGRRGVLVDVRELTAPSPITLLDRWYFARAWACAAEGRVRIACLARPDQDDPGRFGTSVARNLGQTAQVFLDESEAIAWLERR